MVPDPEDGYSRTSPGGKLRVPRPKCSASWVQTGARERRNSFERLSPSRKGGVEACQTRRDDEASRVPTMRGLIDSSGAGKP